MDITLPISSLVLIAIDSVGIILSLSMGMLLLTQKGKGHGSVTLFGILLILTGLTLLNDMLVTSGISNRFPWLYFTPIYYSLSLGPLFYLFVKSKYQIGLKTVDYFHLVLPIFQGLLYWSIGFRDAEFKSYLWGNTKFPVYLQLESLLFPVLLVVYALLAYRCIQFKIPKAYFWSNDLQKWLKRFAIVLIFIACVELFFTLGEVIPASHFGARNLLWLHALVLSTFTFWISAQAFKQYFPLKLYTSSPYKAQSHLNLDDERRLKEDLQYLMEVDKVYLNPDLNLSLLANYLNISEKSCSYLINSVLQSNFNKLVNNYRLKSFEEQVEKGVHDTYTLSGMAYECGFNSKSTFNRVFKDRFGMTPSEYINQAREKSD
ncbi:MAG TPA: AraC family transcriptional regulator [Flavobacteriaceae bacterium]|nr:helix-turn-helix transcriptional regulator [Flavobacteriaceae bacterium]MCB9212581.1 helix-turn-helix transcriptional regulator [Alteromonas sp.]HPF10649.1 AraC family transcriptional regulator [Flavobacteriaceae bacterium]HQU20931.1 AraC family transcriptional regulator [Flavobacteriaceae bacterium]HQU64415.1 AraC family transcriptional regulator [Flavobacteriaceae bacterium]